MDELVEHQTGEGDTMQASHCLWQALIVERQSAEAGDPSEAALHHESGP
jgi:hypothetical protein